LIYQQATDIFTANKLTIMRVWTWVILMTVSIMIGCKKNPVHDRHVTDTSFRTVKLDRFQPIRIFTISGEITDPQIIDHYTLELDNHIYKPSSTFAEASLQKIIYVNEDSIVNVSLPYAIPARRTVIDTYDVYTSAETEIVNDTQSVTYHIGKYPTLSKQLTSTGFEYYVNKVGYVMKKQQDTLFFPILKYMVISRHNYTLNFWSAKTNNVLSVDVYKKLVPKDTLVVQRFDVLMKRNN
jgi:hypothetical protein